MHATDRGGDGGDDSMSSSAIAQKAVLIIVDDLEAIKRIMIQVALNCSHQPEKFQIFWEWKVPRLVMQLSSERLTPVNTSFLVPQAALACEDVPIDLPVLRHLGRDSRTLFWA